jgi:tRNA(Arg) A34 adenosine deaminase TadA
MRLHQVLTLLASLPSTLATQMPLAHSSLMINGVSFEARFHWMRFANQALGDLSGSPCPFSAFGTVVVNHTESTVGELICMGVNENSKTGNPSLHGQIRFPPFEICLALMSTSIGEIAAITNCTSILTDPRGKYRLTATEAAAAFTDLSLYTNAESCPMVCRGTQRVLSHERWFVADSDSVHLRFGGQGFANISMEHRLQRSLRKGGN